MIDLLSAYCRALRYSVRWASTACAVAPNSGSPCACPCELGCDLAVAAFWLHHFAVKKVEILHFDAHDFLS